MEAARPVGIASRAGERLAHLSLELGGKNPSIVFPGAVTDEPPVIFSRAGHDGMALGGLTDIGMLFLRNPDGISHHPAELVTAADVAAVPSP